MGGERLGLRGERYAIFPISVLMWSGTPVAANEWRQRGVPGGKAVANAIRLTRIIVSLKLRFQHMTEAFVAVASEWRRSVASTNSAIIPNTRHDSLADQVFSIKSDVMVRANFSCEFIESLWS